MHPINIQHFKEKLAQKEMEETIESLIRISEEKGLENVNDQLYALGAQFKDWVINVRLGIAPLSEDTKVQRIRLALLELIDQIEEGEDVTAIEFDQTGAQYGNFEHSEAEKTKNDFVKFLDERAEKMRLLFSLLPKNLYQEYKALFDDMHQKYKTAIVSDNLFLMHDLNRDIQTIVIEARTMIAAKTPRTERIRMTVYDMPKKKND